MTSPQASTDDGDLAVARQAAAVALEHGTSLTAALGWYVAHGRPVHEAPNIEACVCAYLDEKRAATRRFATVKNYRVVLTTFAERFAGRAPIAIQPAEIREFLRRWPQPTTLHSRWRQLFTFFNWAVAHGWVFENPLLRAMPRPQRAPQPGKLYTPGDAAWILRRVKGTDQLGVWVLGLFGGIRHAEIRRLQAQPTPWTMIRLEAGVIDLPAAISKNRPRLVPISPVLRAWLEYLRRYRFPIYPRDCAKKMRRVRRLLTQAGRPAAGSPNMARRSFISYRLALPGANYATVAAEAGNSEPMIRNYYRCRVTREAAQEYFSLGPDKFP